LGYIGEAGEDASSTLGTEIDKIMTLFN